MSTGGKGGLEGIVAGRTALCTVGKEGVGLTYRGYTIEDLATHGTFEETAYLLLYGKLPTKTELSEFQARLLAQRAFRRHSPECSKKSRRILTRWTYFERRVRCLDAWNRKSTSPTSTGLPNDCSPVCPPAFSIGIVFIPTHGESMSGRKNHPSLDSFCIFSTIDHRASCISGRWMCR